MPYPWLALASAATAAFILPLESNLVIIALPSIARAFDVPVSSVVWVLVASTLVVLGLTLPVASLSERFGRRRLFRSGYWVYIVGAIVALWAPSLLLLIMARAIQGTGAALFGATRNAVAVEAMPGYRRGLALGVILACVGLGGTVAPFLGGWLVETFGWRAIFAVKVPIALTAALMSFAVLKPEGVEERHRRPFDLPGAVFVFAGLAALLVAGNRLPSLGIGSPLVAGLGSAGIVLLALFFRQETRAENPVLDLSLFRIRAFSVPTIGLILQMLSFTTAVNLVPFFLQDAQGYTPAQTGAIFASISISLFLGSLPGGALSDRFGMWRLSVVTLGVMVLAFFGLITLSVDTGLAAIIAILVVIGLMEGAFQSATAAAQVAALPPQKLASAAALFMIGIQLPLSVGVTLGGTLLSARLAVHTAVLGEGAAAMAAAYREVAIVGTALAVSAFLVTLFFGRTRR
jgi:EmrB/QacA subfamily drug resistance transporter